MRAPVCVGVGGCACVCDDVALADQLEGVCECGPPLFVSICAFRHTTPHHTAPHRNVPLCTSPHLTSPHRATPHRTALQCTIVHHTAPHRTTPHHTAHTTPHRTPLLSKYYSAPGNCPRENLLQYCQFTQFSMCGDVSAYQHMLQGGAKYHHEKRPQLCGSLTCLEGGPR